MHGLMEVDGVSKPLVRIGGDRRPLHAAIRTRKHAGAFFGRQNPHVLLRHHGLGEADQAAILAIVNVDVTGLAGMDHAGDALAVLASHVHQDGWADGVEIPYIVGNVLEVTDILSGVEIERD